MDGRKKKIEFGVKEKIKFFLYCEIILICNFVL